jgi:hypothetical protein
MITATQLGLFEDVCAWGGSSESILKLSPTPVRIRRTVYAGLPDRIDGDNKLSSEGVPGWLYGSEWVQRHAHAANSASV